MITQPPDIWIHWSGARTQSSSFEKWNCASESQVYLSHTHLCVYVCVFVSLFWGVQIYVDDINSLLLLRESEGSMKGSGGPFFHYLNALIHPHTYTYKVLPTYLLPPGSERNRSWKFTVSCFLEQRGWRGGLWERQKGRIQLLSITMRSWFCGITVTASYHVLCGFICTEMVVEPFHTQPM